MDFKSFKQDLTYCCKKFAKDGKTLSSFGDNLTIVEKKFVADGQYLDPLEMFVLIKGLSPTEVQSTIYHEKWQDPQGEWHEAWIPHYTAFNMSMLDVLVEQASMDRGDLNAFLDGFENVLGCGNEKSEYYTLGVYIREKFSPIDARPEPLKSLNNPIYRIQEHKTPERMFTVYTRKNEVSIVEAECYVLGPMDGVSNLPPGEFCALVTAPELLYEKKTRTIAGKAHTELGPAIYYSHSLFRDYHDALASAQDLIEKEFAFKLRKYGTQYTNVDVASAIMTIKLIKLPDSTFKTDAEKVIELMKLVESKTLTPSEIHQKMKESGVANWGVDDPEMYPIWKGLEEKSKKEES